MELVWVDSAYYCPKYSNPFGIANVVARYFQGRLLYVPTILVPARLQRRMYLNLQNNASLFFFPLFFLCYNQIEFRPKSGYLYRGGESGNVCMCFRSLLMV